MPISLGQQECASPSGLVNVVYVDRRLDGEVLEEVDLGAGRRRRVVVVMRVRHGDAAVRLEDGLVVCEEVLELVLVVRVCVCVEMRWLVRGLGVAEQQVVHSTRTKTRDRTTTRVDRGRGQQATTRAGYESSLPGAREGERASERGRDAERIRIS